MNDVWSSVDGGVNWVEVIATAPWGVRYLHTSVVYNNKMYIIAGDDWPNLYDDAWSSDDGGVTWVQVGTIGSARAGARGVVFQNKILVSGGYEASASVNDIWSFEVTLPSPPAIPIPSSTAEKGFGVAWMGVHVGLVGLAAFRFFGN